jgi:hypothetical protein
MSAIEIIPLETRIQGAKVIIAAAVAYVVLRLAGFHQLFASDGEGLAALLQIIGTLYSVVYAFAT